MRPCAYLQELVLHSCLAPFSLFIQPNLFVAISFTPISSLQAFDVDLGHLQHGFENPFRFYRVFSPVSVRATPWGRSATICQICLAAMRIYLLARQRTGSPTTHPLLPASRSLQRTIWLEKKCSAGHRSTP